MSKSSSKSNGAGKSRLNKRVKHLAIVVFRNQTVRRVTAHLRTYETLPRLTQANADKAGIKIALRKHVPDRIVDTIYKGKTAEVKAVEAARSAGFDVVTYQQITFEAARV